MTFIDKYTPFILAIISSFLVYKFSFYIIDFSSLIPIIANSSLTIAGTLLGFLLTILSIISTVQTRRMQFVKDAGKYPDLISFLNKSIFSNVCAIIFSFFILFIKRNQVKTEVLNIIDYLFIFTIFFNLFLTARFAIIFVSLLADKNDKKKIKENAVIPVV